MQFILSKLLWILLAPGHLLLGVGLIGLAGLFAPWPRLRRAARWLLAIPILGFTLLAVLPAGIWLGPLESRFPAPGALPREVHGVVVLGGGFNARISHGRGRPELSAAADRLTALIELARRYPRARLLFSGGSAALLDTEAREADLVADLLDRLGMAADRLIVERNSRNTYENVVLSRALADPRDGQVWLLVTSASHMPRAVGVFRRQDWPVVPYPVDFQTTARLDWRARPDLLRGLGEVTRAMKEWSGLAVYRLLGRSSELFPGPFEPEME
jgi:uncharacterized SAM-binding protein YcdF (DUF218 family)